MYSVLPKSSVPWFLVVLAVIESKIMKSPTIIAEWISALKYLPGALDSLGSKLILCSLPSQTHLSLLH